MDIFYCTNDSAVACVQINAIEYIYLENHLQLFMQPIAAHYNRFYRNNVYNFAISWRWDQMHGIECILSYLVHIPSDKFWKKTFIWFLLECKQKFTAKRP